MDFGILRRSGQQEVSASSSDPLSRGPYFRDPANSPGRVRAAAPGARSDARSAGRCVGARVPAVAPLLSTPSPGWGPDCSECLGVFCLGGRPGAPRVPAEPFCASRSPRGTGRAAPYLHSIPASQRCALLGFPCFLLVIFVTLPSSP